MPKPNKPKVTDDSKNGEKPRRKGIKGEARTKPQLEHALKLELMRTCRIYGKGYEATKVYFESKGFTLGQTVFTELRNELKSSKNSKDWFSKEALYVIEDDHKLSVDRIRMMEDRLLEEFEQVSATNFYKYINAGTETQELIRNKAHDSNLLLRIVAQFQSLQETKTKMFSATPMVQEMLEVHARRQEEEEIMHRPPPVAKQEKEIANE